MNSGQPFVESWNSFTSGLQSKHRNTVWQRDGTDSRSAGRYGDHVSPSPWNQSLLWRGGGGGGEEGASDVTDSNKSSAAIAVLFKDSYELSFAVFVSETIKLHL